MNKFGKILLTSVLAASLVVTPVLAAPDVDSIRQSKEASESALNSLKNDLAKTITKINQLEEDLVATGEKIAVAEIDLAAAQEKEVKQYEAMKKRIRYMYEDGNTSFFEVFFEAKSITELLNKAEYVKSMHEYDRDMLKEYEETKNTIANLKNELEVQQQELLNTQREFEAEKDNISAMVEDKKAEIAELDEELQAAIIQEAAERAAEEQRRKEEEERRQQEANNNNNNNSNGNNSGNGSGTNNSNGSQGSNDSKPGGGNSSDNSNAGSGDTSVANAIVSAAYSQLGVPYVWGGTTPGKGLDCSGLTQYAHRVAGISIPRTSGPQGSGGKAVSNPQPGDIVCYSGHVGIYIGGGKMIHAPEPGDVVKVSNVYGSPWYRRYW